MTLRRTTLVQGPPGPIGPTGSATTTTTAPFTVPAINGTVSVSLASTVGMVAGQVLFIANAGYYQVVSVTSVIAAVLQNLGYVGNAASGAIVANPQVVVPGGLQGISGSPLVSHDGTTLPPRPVLAFVGGGGPQDDGASNLNIPQHPYIIRGVHQIPISSSTNASPIVLSFASAHLLRTGDQVDVAGHLVNTNANGHWTITVLDSNRISLNGSTGNGVGAASGTTNRDDTPELNAWLAGHPNGGVIRLVGCSIQQGKVPWPFPGPAGHVRIEIDGQLYFTQQNATLEHGSNFALVGLGGANTSITQGCASAAEIVPPAIDTSTFGSAAQISALTNGSYFRIVSTSSGATPTYADVGSTITISGSSHPENNQTCKIIAFHHDSSGFNTLRIVRSDGGLLVSEGLTPPTINWAMSGGRAGTGLIDSVQTLVKVTGLSLRGATQVNDVGQSGSWKHYLALWGHTTNADCNGVFRIFGAESASIAYVSHDLLSSGFSFNGTTTAPFTPDSVNLNWNEVIPLICGRFATSKEYRNLMVLFWAGITFLEDGAWDLAANYEFDSVFVLSRPADGFQPAGYYGSIPLVVETAFECWYRNCAFEGLGGAPLWYFDTSVKPVITSVWFSGNGGSANNNGFVSFQHFNKCNTSTGAFTSTSRAKGLSITNNQTAMNFRGLGLENTVSPGVINVDTRELMMLQVGIDDSFAADASSVVNTFWAPFAIPQPMDLTVTKCFGIGVDAGYAKHFPIDGFIDTNHKGSDADDWILGGDPSGSDGTALEPRHYSATDLGRTDAFLLGKADSGAPSINTYLPVAMPSDPFDPVAPWSSLPFFATSNLTITKVRGPRGLLTAAKLHTTNPSGGSMPLIFSGASATYPASGLTSINVGDIVIAGAWLRSSDSTKGFQAGFNFQVVAAASQNPLFDSTTTVLSPGHDEIIRRSGGGWRHWTQIGKVTRAGTSGASGINFVVGCLPSRDVEIDEPFLVVIPASAGLPEDEVIRMYRHGRYFRTGTPVGVSAVGRYESLGIGPDVAFSRDITDASHPAWKTSNPIDAFSFRVAGTTVLGNDGTMSLQGSTATVGAGGNVPNISTLGDITTTTSAATDSGVAFAMPASSVLDVTVSFTLYNTGGTGGTAGDSYAFDMRFRYVRVGSAAPVAFSTSPVKLNSDFGSNNGEISATAQAALSGNTVKIQVLGVSGHTLKWAVSAGAQERN